jgi:hypothetical protein
MFIFKQRKIVVDCFVNQAIVVEECPIKRSSAYTPQWWKDLEVAPTRSIGFGIDMPFPTMKTCSGFVYLFSNSWTIPLWTDLIVTTTEEGTWNYCVARTIEKIGLESVNSHNRRQFGKSFENHIHLKFESPWIISDKASVKFLFASADWNLISEYPDLRIPLGLINFKDTSHPNVNAFVPKKNATYSLSAGTPMVYLIPLTERKVEFKNHLVSDEEYAKMSKYITHRSNKFRNGLQKW